jgi:hypothetical protein
MLMSHVKSGGGRRPRGKEEAAEAAIEMAWRNHG